MNAHDPWAVQPPVLHPTPPGGDAQIAAILAMRPYVPAPQNPKTRRQTPHRFVVLHLIAGAVIGIVAFVALCAGFWLWDVQAHTSASGGPANAHMTTPVVRGFEGG